MPQIRDMGIVALRTPTSIGPACDGCASCAWVCREGAIVIQPAGRAELHPQRCVGCGACIRACPHQVIDAGKVYLRVLVGGRMGRHPRWAEQLCIVPPESLADALHALLDDLAREARAGEGAASVVERIGIARLAQRISPTVDNHDAADET